MRSPSAAFRLRPRGCRPRQPEPPLPKGGCPSAHTGAGGYVFPASPPSGGESLRRHLHLRKKPLDGSAPGRLRIRPKHVLRFACAAGTSGRPSPTRGTDILPYTKVGRSSSPAKGGGRPAVACQEPSPRTGKGDRLRWMRSPLSLLRERCEPKDLAPPAQAGTGQARGSERRVPSSP